MSSRVTQCPKCLTSFRVTDAQLDIAGGAVRCGSCLHIFNAQENWLDTDNNAPITAASQTPADETFDSIFDDDDILIDDDFLLEDEDQPDAAKSPSDSNNDKNREATDLPENDPDEELLFDDDNPLISDTGTHPAFSSKLISDDNLEIDTHSTDEYNTFIDIEEFERKHNSPFKDLDELGDDGEESDEGWAKKLLEEEMLKPPQEKPAPFEEYPEIFEEPTTNKAEGDDIDPELLSILDDEQEQPHTDSEDEFVLDTSFAAGERIGSQSLLYNIEPEPVEMAWRADHSRWKSIGWIAATVIAILSLAGQYIYFNFDQLARDQSYRPILAGICPTIGCTLPSLDDISRIRSSNLMVRSHPSINRALVVDAIVTNRAEFRQPFPVMELIFTDLNGSIVASRRFQPSEYLAGEMLGSTLMPSRQPVHISLDLIDPGQHAVNYQMNFYRSDDS